MYWTDLRILTFTIITSGRVLKLMVAKLISITRVKKISVKSEVNYLSTRNTEDSCACVCVCVRARVCHGRQAAEKRECNLLDVHSLI